jgi:CMP-N,N'-diacetyllegionaminic acid synthase
MMKKVLGIIPARGGSKGVPNKNIRPLAGIPLIAHSIRVAKASGIITTLAVSTDSDAIASVSISEGAMVIKRPSELSQDHSLVIDAIRHVVESLEQKGEVFDFILLLEPTSPLRTGQDIVRTVSLLSEPGIDSVTSFSETKIPPARLWRIRENIVEPFIPGSNAFLPRQKLEKAYYINGIIYGFKARDLKQNPSAISILFGKTAPIIIPEERVIDIDSETDFKMAETLFKK